MFLIERHSAQLFSADPTAAYLDWAHEADLAHVAVDSDREVDLAREAGLVRAAGLDLVADLDQAVEVVSDRDADSLLAVDLHLAAD